MSGAHWRRRFSVHRRAADRRSVYRLFGRQTLTFRAIIFPSTDSWATSASRRQRTADSETTDMNREWWFDAAHTQIDCRWPQDIAIQWVAASLIRCIIFSLLLLLLFVRSCCCIFLNYLALIKNSNPLVGVGNLPQHAWKRATVVWLSSRFTYVAWCGRLDVALAGTAWSICKCLLLYSYSHTSIYSVGAATSSR